jgi:hypothetical protein
MKQTSYRNPYVMPGLTRYPFIVFKSESGPRVKPGVTEKWPWDDGVRVKWLSDMDKLHNPNILIMYIQFLT